MIISGDFNINLLKLNEKDIFFEFFDVLSTLIIYTKITYPTKFSDHNAILIDNIYSTLSQLSIN